MEDARNSRTGAYAEGARGEWAHGSNQLLFRMKLRSLSEIVFYISLST